MSNEKKIIQTMLYENILFFVILINYFIKIKEFNFYFLISIKVIILIYCLKNYFVIALNFEIHFDF